jgi:hypothetical protein
LKPRKRLHILIALLMFATKEEALEYAQTVFPYQGQEARMQAWQQEMDLVHHRTKQIFAANPGCLDAARKKLSDLADRKRTQMNDVQTKNL